MTEPSIRGHPGESGHDGGERSLDGGIEMLSHGERFERKACGFHPFSDAVMSENLNLDPTCLQCARDGQLRGDVAAAVHDGE
jgi:hypothetical protein